MTDSEIIKALEYLCKNTNDDDGRIVVLAKLVLDLIERQQAEIDNMKDTMAKLLNTLERANKYGLAADERIEQLKIELEKSKSEAVREFAGKLAIKLAANYSDKYCRWIDDTIYELVEEMGCNDG